MQMIIHFFMLAVYIFAIALSGLILHELGHLVLGLLLHFRFSYIEIMGLRISANNHKWQIQFQPKINSKICMNPIGIRYIIARTIIYYSGGFLSTGIILLFSLFYRNTLYNLVLEILSFFITIMPLLPYKNSDISYITNLLNKKKRGTILIPFYLYNGYTPQDFPDEWFAFLETESPDPYDMLLYKMKYFKELEAGNDREILKYYNILSDTFIKSKYLADKCEILFFLAMVEKNHMAALFIKDKLEEKIRNGKFTSRTRMLCTINYLTDKQVNCEEKINGTNPGIIKLEENLIHLYF